jgi:hypothetical protein
MINLGAVWRRSEDGRNVNGLSREEGERVVQWRLSTAVWLLMKQA